VPSTSRIWLKQPKDCIPHKTGSQADSQANLSFELWSRSTWPSRASTWNNNISNWPDSFRWRILEQLQHKMKCNKIRSERRSTKSFSPLSLSLSLGAKVNFCNKMFISAPAPAALHVVNPSFFIPTPNRSPSHPFSLFFPSWHMWPLRQRMNCSFNVLAAL